MPHSESIGIDGRLDRVRVGCRVAGLGAGTAVLFIHYTLSFMYTLVYIVTVDR